MMNNVFLPKEDHEIPDSYKIIINYIDGRNEEFELASHFFNKETGILEFWVKEDICHWIIIDNVKRIEFDKNFSKLIAIRQKMDKKMDKKEAD